MTNYSALDKSKMFVIDFLFLMRVAIVMARAIIKHKLGFNLDECFVQCVHQLGLMNMFFVKAMQSLSTNTDLLTQTQIDYLTRYTDNVPYNLNELNKQFFASFEQTARRMKYSFVINNNQKPIKSGMIALIYEAKINSKKVIVKVMREGISDRLKDALRQLRLFVSLIHWLPYVKNMQLMDLLQENEVNMLAQVNFNMEMRNISRMAKNCKHTAYINIPNIYPEFTQDNSSIIVMEHLEGRNIGELTDIEKDDYAKLLAKFGMKCLLFNRFYHADLHAGNILFMKTISHEPQLGILDFGLMGEINKEEQNNFYKFFTSLAKCIDNKVIADNILQGLVTPAIVLKDMAIWKQNNLREDLGLLVGDVLDNKRNFTPSDIYNINKLLRKYDLQLSRSFCRIELALAISDSVSSKLSCETCYIDNVKDAVKTMMNDDIISSFNENNKKFS